MMQRPVVLTIAGSDPSGGAGIQSDLRTFHSLGAIGTSVITALTAQNTHFVASVHPIDEEHVSKQLQILLDDIRPDAVKIGMLGSSDQAHSVAGAIQAFGLRNIVLDPVLASTGGVPLIDDDGIHILLTELMPLCTVVTPNIAEAERLTGLTIHGTGDMERAAKRLIELGAKAAIVKGGHLLEHPTDVLVLDDGTIEHRGSARIETTHTHGTGCLYSSALAVFLAQGMTLKEAFHAAKDLINTALENPVVIGSGRGYPETPSPPNNQERSLVQTHPIPSQREGAFANEKGLQFLTIRQADKAVYKGERPYSSGRTRGGVPNAGMPLVIGREACGIYLVTDPKLRPDRSHLDIARAALEGGAQIVQLRDKYASARQLIEMGQAMAALCRDYDALFIVNDRVDIAMACNADGVHLGPDDMPPAQAREILGPGRIIGVSVNSVEEAEPLIPYTTYLGVGAIFGSTTKIDAGAPIGVGRIREIKATFPTVPLVAIGGINHNNIGDVFAAGADSAAVVSAIICADDMTAATRALIAKK